MVRKKWPVAKEAETVQDAVAKAAVLVEALPYIKRFYGKTVVIKYGGNAMLNEELKAAVINDIILMRYVGMRPVVVHGGGPEITALLKQLGRQSQFVAGLRVTDEATMEVAQMVLVGKVNAELVTLINRHGGRAVGLSGLDGALLVAEKRLARVPTDSQQQQVDIGYVGNVVKVNPDILHTLLDEGYIPVVAPVAVGTDWHSYNINADLAAGEVAGALQAEKLVLLTDVEGIFRDFRDRGTLISTLQLDEIDGLVQNGTIDGGMLPKVEACVKALRQGVAKTHIIDGRLLHSLLLEVFTDRGIGTEVVQ